MKLINNCIHPFSKYCSGLYYLEWIQNFDIIVFKFLLSSIKYSSGISELMISYSRYKSVNDKSNNTKKFHFKKNIFIISVIGLLLNSLKLYEFKLNDSHNISFPQERFDGYFCSYFDCSIILNVYNGLVLLTPIIGIFIFDLCLFKSIKNSNKKKKLL